jgi:hypothetical protein
MQALRLRPSAAARGLARVRPAPGLAALRQPARRSVCRAEGGDAEALPGALTLEDARGVLGVGAAASFDDIMSAKNRKLEGADGDAKLKVPGSLGREGPRRGARAPSGRTQTRATTSAGSAPARAAPQSPRRVQPTTHPSNTPRSRRRTTCCSCTP